MKKLITLAFALIVAASMLAAQDTGGDKNHKGKQTTTATSSDHDQDHDKDHKGGKKGKKGASTTPPPK